MDIRSLRSMLAIIETGSLNKAAERLNVSQPALTKTIQRMEGTLGVKLFERDTRGMHPTAYAEDFRAYAQAACAGYDRALASLSASKSGLQNSVTIASTPLLSSSILPPAVVRVAERNPEFRIKLDSRGQDLLDWLIAGKCDLALIPLDGIRDEGLAQRYLINDQWVVIARPGHPLTKKRHVTVQDLHACGWIYSDSDSFHRRRLQRFFEDAGLAMPASRIISRPPTVQKALVACSDYVSLVARLSVEDEAKRGDLKIIEIDSALMMRPIGFLWRESERLSTAAKALIGELEAVCRERGYR